jgi:uncharacterized protein YutE (UPF0331/DUF86 family)
VTDPDLVGKRLAIIDDMVASLRRADLSRLQQDEREQRFVLHTLQIAIQAAIDVALHLVSEDRAGEPKSYGDAFILLARRDMIPFDLAKKLEGMAGMRNVIVHVYADVDLERIRRAVEHDLSDLLSFVAAIRPLL